MINLVEKKVVDLIPYDKNPRKNDKAVDYVANSIREFGFKIPIVIDKNDVVVAGHTRLKACKKLGIESVPCIVADDLNEEQIKAFRIADNKVSEMASWDDRLLNEELNELMASFDMTNFGFNIQIENIDEYFEGEEKIAVELDEYSDYVVLEFKNENDWNMAVELFGLERCATSDKNKKIRRFGIGRVLDGVEAIKKIKGEKNED